MLAGVVVFDVNAVVVMVDDRLDVDLSGARGRVLAGGVRFF